MIRHWGKNTVIVIALVAAGFFVAWLRFRPWLGTEGRYTDGTRDYDVQSGDEVRYAVWDDPLPLAGEVNSSADEGRPAFSPDGRLLVFAVGARGLGSDLWAAPIDDDGAPGTPYPLAAVNSAADELAPAFAAGFLWFASDRRGTAGGLDLWRAEYREGVLGEVERVGGGLNSSDEDTDPAPIPGTRDIVFASNRPRGRRSDFELYLARPAAGTTDPLRPSFEVSSLDELNTGFDEREPAFTADGRTLFFASDRDGGDGDFDLWRSAIGLVAGADRRWLDPEPLTGVNTPASERAPCPSPDGFTLYFAGAGDAPSSGAAASTDLFRARSLELFRTPGRPVGWLDLLILAALLALALLAWLAKQWEAIEVVYKCFLVSLVVHLLLMWWFREVHPEANEYELAGGSDRIRVRLVQSSAAASSNAERAGSLEAERQMAEAERAPERVVVETPSTLPEVQPTETRLSRPAPTADDESLAQGAPAREAGATPERAEAPAPQAVAVATPAERVERRRGEARSMQLEPASEGAAAERPERAAGDQPARAEGAASDALARLAEPLPSAQPVARSGDRPGLPDAPRAEGTQVAPTAASDAGEVAVAQPRESVERRMLREPELVLEASSASERVARVEPELERRLEETGGERPNLLEADGGEAPAPQGPLALPERGAGGASGEPDLLADLFPARTGSAATPSRPALPEIALEQRFERQTPPLEEPSQGSSAPGAETLLELDDSLAESWLADALATRPRAADRLDDLVPRRLDGSELERHAADTEPVPAWRPLAADQRPEPVAAAPDVSRWEHTPYQSRSGEQKLRAIEVHGGSQETEAAVAAGLAYLASIQQPDGYWGSPEDRHEKYGHVVVGKSGLCLLAFMGAGHTQRSNSAYSKVVGDTIDFLLAVQHERSGHFGYTSSYGHAIATYALAECFALTQDEALREPLERAVAQIVSKQEHSKDQRLFGGWGYYYPDGHTFDPWPRASITAWQVMALESARLGGLEVESRVFDDAKAFLARCWDRRRGAYRYNHDPDRLSSNYAVLPGSTPASLFALSLLGDDISTNRFGAARAWVLERTPRAYEYTGVDDFVHRASGNLYFWYYATLAMFRVGGEPWARWNEAMKGALIQGQEPNGSWKAISTYAFDYAGDERGDRSYSTAMCVLTLEVYYRYFTPLLKVE